MKILVTGHKGYIGSHIFNELKYLNYDVCGIDLKDGGDILDSLPDKDFDYVFHLAAQPRVEFCVENPSKTMEQNVLVTSTLLQWAKDHNVKRVIFSSSSAANGDGDGIPKSPYGLHKLISEMECKLYSDLYGLDTVCLRYFNVYSSDQSYTGSYSTAICAWMEMIRQGKPLRIDGDGEQTRDLVYVEDIVSANICAMQSENYFGGKVYNVGSGKAVSLNFIRDFIDKKYDNINWVNAPERTGDVKHALADITKTKKDLGFKPLVSIEEGLSRCFSSCSPKI